MGRKSEIHEQIPISFDKILTGIADKERPRKHKDRKRKARNYKRKS